MDTMRMACLATLLVVGCVRAVGLGEGEPCPCAVGYTCCVATNTCLAPTTACPAADGGAIRPPRPDALTIDTASPTGATAVEGCTLFSTLAQADVFFKARCASGSGCHTRENAHRWQDYESPQVWQRMRGAPGIMSCAGVDRVIEIGGEWRKSMLLVKTTAGSPICSNKAPAGEQMPPQSLNDGGVYRPLDADEKNCIDLFVSVAAQP